MTTKEEMRRIIDEVKDGDRVFLFDTLGGLDLMNDAVNSKLDRMPKSGLRFYYEKALQVIKENPEKFEEEKK